VSLAETRPCVQCKEPVVTGESRCPHCGAAQPIVTAPIEAVPPDTGEPSPTGELLPLEEEELPASFGVTSRSASMSTSFTTRTVSGSGSRLDAEVKIDLPQAVVDPENRLSPAAYWKLMHRWSQAIEDDLEGSCAGGRAPDLSAVVTRVPLPFGPDCGGELPVAIRDMLTQRAQRQAAQLFRLPRPADVFGPHAGPDGGLPLRELMAAAERASRPRRGFTVSCGSVLGGLLLLATMGAVLIWWSAAS
jgi:hypothetical protein